LDKKMRVALALGVVAGSLGDVAPTLGVVAGSLGDVAGSIVIGSVMVHLGDGLDR
jgi:hypothetical protein